MDYLRNVGKVIVFEVNKLKNDEVYQQKIATKIKVVTKTELGYEIEITPVYLRGDFTSEQKLTLLQIDDENKLKARIELYDDDLKLYSATIFGEVLEIY